MENENKITQENQIQEVTENTVDAAPEVNTEVADESVSEASSVKRCIKCQAVLSDEQVFCPECGASQKKLCVQCGAELSETQSFCDKCGTKVEMQPQLNTAPINNFNNTVVQNKNKKVLPFIIGGICIAVVAVALVFGKAGGVNFEKTFADISGESWCEIADDGSWMRLDTNPYDLDDEIDLDAWDAITEVNEKLGFSDSLMEKMGETRSLDGRLYEENDKVKVSWTYHPDDGLEVLYEKK